MKAVQTMKRIIDDNKLTVMCTVARSACPYDTSSKEMWDKSNASSFSPSHIYLSDLKLPFYSALPEHGAHFCDLSRYLAGEIDLSSITARSLEWAEEPAYLSKVPIDENQIAFQYRIPRVTAATWCG
jgi:predicted dehydrogenase